MKRNRWLIRNSQPNRFDHDWDKAPVALDRVRPQLIIMKIKGHRMTREMYYDLPEIRDAERIASGEFFAFGQMVLDQDFLDLVCIKENGDIYAAPFTQRDLDRRKGPAWDYIRRLPKVVPTIR